MWDKPFKTYGEQILHLKSIYGLNIENTVKAEKILSTHSYYNLVNGYKEIFMINEKYQNNTNIDTLYVFSLLDRDIQSILFKYSVYVELIFKTRLAYYISENFGVTSHEYLDKQKYVSLKPNNKKYTIFEKTFKSIDYYISNKNLKYMDDPTKHYYSTKNHIPPWILFKNITFSNVTNLYSFLKSTDKTNVANSVLDIDLDIEKKKELLLNALIIIRKFRNSIAHDLKFITFNTKNYQLIIKDIIPYFENTMLYENEDTIDRGRNDIYAMILSILLLIDDNNLKIKFVYDLMTEIDFYIKDLRYLYDLYIQKTNLPVDFNKRLLNYAKSLRDKENKFDL